jgi:hypothetical protein
MGWNNRPDCDECGGMWELYEIINLKRCNCDTRPIDIKDNSEIDIEGESINGGKEEK